MAWVPHRKQWATNNYKIASVVHSAVRVRMAGASIQAGQCRASPRPGPATLSLFQDKRIVSTLVAARHEGGHRAPQMWAAVHAEDRVTLSHTAGVQEELSHAWPSLLLVEGKVCAVHVPLSSGPW